MSSTLPSGCRASPDTSASAPRPDAKLESRPPSALSRAMLLRNEPFAPLNHPPISTLPSGCSSTARTIGDPPVSPTKSLPAVGSNVRSSEPGWAERAGLANTKTEMRTRPNAQGRDHRLDRLATGTDASGSGFPVSGSGLFIVHLASEQVFQDKE